MSVLRVYYLFGGRTFLLHWWTYDDRGHLVLAPTERGLVAVAKRVFAEHPDAEIRAYCEIDIVGPSKRLQALAADQAMRERVGAFHHEVVSHMRDAVEAGRTLPPIFESCSTYEPGEEEHAADEVFRGMHYGCRHCLQTIRLVGLTPGDLYARYHDAWRVEHPLDHLSRYEVMSSPSRAGLARDDEKLWYARAAFGHHSAGIALDEVDVEEPDTLSDGGYSCLSGDALFFFRRLRDLDASLLQAALDEAKALDEARRAERKATSVAERKREEHKQLDATIAFFTREAPVS